MERRRAFVLLSVPSRLGSLIRINDAIRKIRKKRKKEKRVVRLLIIQLVTAFYTRWPGIEINYGQIARYLYVRRYVDKVSLSRATILFFAVVRVTYSTRLCTTTTTTVSPLLKRQIVFTIYRANITAAVNIH